MTTRESAHDVAMDRTVLDVFCSSWLLLDNNSGNEDDSFIVLKLGRVEDGVLGGCTTNADVDTMVAMDKAINERWLRGILILLDST